MGKYVFAQTVLTNYLKPFHIFYIGHAKKVDYLREDTQKISFFLSRTSKVQVQPPSPPTLVVKIFFN